VRQFDRTAVQLEGAVLDPRGGQQQEIEIQNIGFGGLMFRSDRPYAEESLVRLKVEIDSESFVVDAEIRHVQEDLRGYSVGVEFVTSSPPFIFKVQELLKAAGASEADYEEASSWES